MVPHIGETKIWSRFGLYGRLPLTDEITLTMSSIIFAGECCMRSTVIYRVVLVSTEQEIYDPSNTCLPMLPV